MTDKDDKRKAVRRETYTFSFNGKAPVTTTDAKKPSVFRRAVESLRILGQPKKEPQVKETRVAILGVPEQNYGIYETPSFRQQVDTFWKDPIINEAITMFAQQVVATGAFLTFNPEYKVILNGKTAFEVIKEWYDVNNIDTKLLEIAIELKAFGNSFWRIGSQYGFAKIPVEAAWHMVRVEADIPLQERYNLQLTPIYGGVVLPWQEFIHFRTAITGYHAPFGHGVLWGLLAQPMDSEGNAQPSLYDIRLSMRGSLHEGFKKFSFGNELWIFEGMSNEDFAAPLSDGKTIGEHIAEMSTTGNRIATNAKGRIELAVPERTQSYDAFIKQMRDEFFMSLADPSLKLGLEMGFTKATSVTASEVYKYKIATMRKSIKEHFEDLFEQILNDLGYDGKQAGIIMNFGPEEVAVYDIADIFSAVSGPRPIITPNEARKLLSKYHKWDIEGDIEHGDEVPELIQGAQSPKATRTPQETLMQHQEEAATGKPDPKIIVTPLRDAVARYNKDLSIIYIDPVVETKFHPIIKLEEVFEYNLEFGMGLSLLEAENIAKQYAHTVCERIHIPIEEYDAKMKEYLAIIKSRETEVENPIDTVHHLEE